MAIDIFAGASGPGITYEYGGIALDGIDIIRTNAPSAPNVRSAEDLGAKIKAANGKLTVNANSSDLIVALNNSLRFPVIRNTSGNYVLTDRLAGIDLTMIALFGGLALLAVVLISQK